MSDKQEFIQSFIVTFSADAPIGSLPKEGLEFFYSSNRSVSFGFNRLSGKEAIGSFLRAFKPDHEFVQQLDELLAAPTPDEGALEDLRGWINAMEWTAEELLYELRSVGVISIVMNSIIYRGAFFHTEVTGAAYIGGKMESLELSGETVLKQLHQELNVQYVV
ncbi:hypothetical protein AB7Z50_17800 [Providencia rettgeri]